MNNYGQPMMPGMNQQMMPGMSQPMMPGMSQPMMPGMSQPMMPGMSQPMLGMMGQQMMTGMMGYTQPVFKQLNLGAGIDTNEYNRIVQAATTAYSQKLAPLSTSTANLIKQYLHGEWFVFISAFGDNDFNFSLTSVAGGDFLAFTLDSTYFQVCRLK